MVHLTNTESALIDQLLDGLGEAISEIPDVELDYANKTKVQKLLYFAIDEFDIPITYSWYLAGAVVPDRSIGPSSLDGPVSGPTGPSGPNLPSIADDTTHDSSSVDPILFTGDSNDDSGSPDTHRDDLSTYVNQEELTDFFRSVIPEVWKEGTMRFLQNFYQEMAPDRYRLLYIESTHLRTHIAELFGAVKRHIDGEEPERSIGALRKSIELSISDFHYYLRQDDLLEQVFSTVVEGTNLIEDALLMLDNHPRSKYTESHLKLLEKIREFFFYYVWKYPCLLISQQTATGPSASDLRAEHHAEFETFGEKIRDTREELESELRAGGLAPGPNDYPPVKDEQIAKTLSDLSTEYLE